MITIVLVALSIVVAAAAWWLVKRDSTVLDPKLLPNRLRRVDFLAFQNLMNEADTQFLRQNLTRRDFRRVQRARILAAIGYLAAINHNAGLLVRLGDIARRDPEPGIAKRGALLMSTAIAVRAHCFRMFFRFGIQIVFPSPISTSVGRLRDDYAALREHLAGLSLVQDPLAGSRAASVL